MSNDAEAQEVHPTVTRPGSHRESLADGTAEPSGLVSEENVADTDAVIIEEAPPATASVTRPDVIPEARPDVIPEAARPQPSANGDAGLGGDPERIHERWAAIQATFVDDPRGSVAAAADLVTETIAALVASAEQRESGLRGEWDREGADTENLRNTLRSYRGFLDRLVAI
jgi:hypothetical protein